MFSRSGRDWNFIAVGLIRTEIDRVHKIFDSTTVCLFHPVITFDIRSRLAVSDSVSKVSISPCRSSCTIVFLWCQTVWLCARGFQGTCYVRCLDSEMLFLAHPVSLSSRGPDLWLVGDHLLYMWLQIESDSHVISFSDFIWDGCVFMLQLRSD